MRVKYNQILEKISFAESLFRENKAIILSEDDLKCLIFHFIYDLFNHNSPTFNNQIKGSPLHAEIKIFNEQGKLYYRPDIIILNPNNYSILHSISDFIIKEDKIIYKPTSSKEFEFGGDVILIELKFCKNKKGIVDIKSFKKDIDKMRIIKQLIESDNRSKVLGLLAIFNKTSKKSRQLDDFIASFNSSDDIQAKYYSGELEI